MRCAALLLLGVLACASTPSGPVFHDETYLRFGVDPREEEVAVIESQKARAYRLGLRVHGQHFTALGFMDKSGRSSAVRILTVRGTAIALDSRPEGQMQPAVTYALLAPPIADTYDADHDGFDEVFVEQRSPGKTCLQVYRVRDVGFVDRVVVDSRIFGQDVCARAAIDLDVDGIVELVTEVELLGFPRGGASAEARRMFLPLWANQHQFVARAGSAAQRAWLTQERTRREAELQQARGRLDVANCYALGIELAALAYLDGGDRDAQIAAFDRALRGLVLQPAQAAANLTARGRIYSDWNRPDDEPAAAPTPTPARETRAAKVQSEQAPTAQLKAAARPREVRRATHVPADYDGPPLAEGDLVITPQSGAPTAGPRRAAGSPTNTAAAAPPSLDAAEVVAYRNTARELGNAAVAARMRAAEARRAGVVERREAQAARLRAAEATDPATAAELRKAVEGHVAAAERHAAEAAEHSAEAARQRAALDAHRATAPPVLAKPQ
jgi:hypothetical protein